MALADETWEAASFHRMVLEFLRGERDRASAGPIRFPATLIDEANLDHRSENAARLAILNCIRFAIIGEVPPDTSWFVVSFLRARHLSELRAIGHADWIDSRDNNELPRVATRTPFQLTADPRTWALPILWGHSKSGPLTILEGNHRLAAYARSVPEGAGGFELRIIVGLSPSACWWHLEDQLAMQIPTQAHWHQTVAQLQAAEARLRELEGGG